jgi:hypothetical protein
MYDILKVMGKDAEFLYYTIDTYIEDADKSKKRARGYMEKNSLIG